MKKYPKYVKYIYKNKTYTGKVLKTLPQKDFPQLEVEFITEIKLKKVWNADWPFPKDNKGSLKEITEEEYLTALVMET